MNDIDEVRNSLEAKSLKVCVVGIGRIGLPTALSFANVGLQTIGVDINEKLINSINLGNFPLKDEPGYEEIFNKVRKDGNFSATTNINEAISNSNLILLSLPTPMDKKNIPNYSALESVCKQLSDILQPNSLIVIEAPKQLEFQFPGTLLALSRKVYGSVALYLLEKKTDKPSRV